VRLRVSDLASYTSTKQAEDATKGAPALYTRNRGTVQAPSTAIYYDGYMQKELLVGKVALQYFLPYVPYKDTYNLW
jgi:hypothetical protein